MAYQQPSFNGFRFSDCQAHITSSLTRPEEENLETNAPWLNASRYARFKAQQLVTAYRLPRYEADDLFQDFLLDYLKRLPNYDATRSGHSTFAQRVIDNHAASQLEHRTAAKRDYRLCKTFTDCAKRTDHTANSDDSGSVESAFDPPSDSDPEWDTLRVDVRRAISSLPPDLANLARDLSEFTVTEIVEMRGCSRSSVYQQKTKIREAFMRAGLDAYVSGVAAKRVRRTSIDRAERAE